MSSIDTATWVGAVSTSLAVIVALMKDDIIGLWRRPNLDVALKPHPPDCHKIPIAYINNRTGQVVESKDSYYLRLWIENNGRARATDLQVFAAALHRRHADGNFKPEANFLPMNLRWAHSQHAPSGPEIFAAGLSPGMGKHCDLGHIVRPAADKEAVLELDLEVAPNTNSHIVPPGQYKLEIRIAAANSRPITRFIEINLTGEFFDDEAKMFSDGLGLGIDKKM